MTARNISILGLIHGIGLRMLSIGAKILFLLAVVPSLPVGVFSSFFFFSTVALMIARFFGYGIELELPLRIRGQVIRARPLPSTRRTISTSVSSTKKVENTSTRPTAQKIVFRGTNLEVQ